MMIHEKMINNSLITFIWKGLLSFQRIILITTSVIILISICLNVVFRYILEMDLRGVEEINIIVAFWLYFIGASYGTYKKQHINADLITSIFKENSTMKIYVDALISFITFLLCIVLLVWATDFMIESIRMGAKSTTLNIPIAFSHSSIFLSFILMSLYFFVHFFTYFIKVLNRNRK